MLRSFTGLFLIALLGLVGLMGCQTPVVFTPPSPEWASFQGQMHYSNATGKSVVGEFAARRAPDGREFQLQFSSGPGFPLLKLWQAGENARAEGVFARGSWHGRTAGAPPALKNWVRLREVFAQLSPGRNDLRGPGWTASATYAGGVAQRCDVAFVETGEHFDFQFSR